MAAEMSRLAYNITACNYSYRSTPCIENLDLELNRGQMYGLIGPNGSGKTTLINLLTGHTRPSSGNVLLFERKVHSYPKPELAQKISLVPQNVAMEFEYTVFEVVMMGRHPFIQRFGSPSEHDVSLVEAALITLDIFHLRDRLVTRLSGGERQRVLVARALAQNTDVMLLDEATASLDVRHSIDIMKALRNRVDKEGATVIGAVHDLDLAAAFCDKLIVMENGRVKAFGPVDDVLTSELLYEVFAVEADVIDNQNGATHIQYRYHHA